MSTKVTLSLASALSIVITFIVGIISYWLLPYTPTQSEILSLLGATLISSFVLSILFLTSLQYIAEYILESVLYNTDKLEDLIRELKDSKSDKEIKKLLSSKPSSAPSCPSDSSISNAIKEAYNRLANPPFTDKELNELLQHDKGDIVLASSISELLKYESLLFLGDKIKIKTLDTVVLTIEKNKVSTPLIIGKKFDYILYDLNNKSLVNFMEAKHEQQKELNKAYKSILDNIIEVESHFDVEALENQGMLKLGDRVHIFSTNEVFKVISLDTTVDKDSKVIHGVKYNYLSLGIKVSIDSLKNAEVICNKRNNKVTEVETIDVLLNLGTNEASVGAIIIIRLTGSKYRVLDANILLSNEDIKGKNFNFRRLK